MDEISSHSSSGPFPPSLPPSPSLSLSLPLTLCLCCVVYVCVCVHGRTGIPSHHPTWSPLSSPLGPGGGAQFQPSEDQESHPIQNAGEGSTRALLRRAPLRPISTTCPPAHLPAELSFWQELADPPGPRFAELSCRPDDGWTDG